MPVVARILVFSLTFSVVLSALASDQHPCARLLKLAPASYEYEGLTTEGVEALKRSRDAVRERYKIFQTNFRSMEMIHKVGMVTRLTKKNMFLYGPPGGAKSMFVDWLLSGELEESYKLQLHQMVTEQAFLGKQVFEDGRFDVDTDTGLAKYRNALFDEIDKGNPAALAVTLSLLNERKLLMGSTVIDTMLESVFSTSNANLPEIFEQFRESGMGSTAPALLSRFQFKAFVYNWLSIENQTALDQASRRKKYLEALKDAYPEVMSDQSFLVPPPLNWSGMRQLAHGLFQPSPSWTTSYLHFVRELRDKTFRAIRESEQKHRQDSLEEPFVYFPSADYNERLRNDITDVVLMSAFVDFLLSPLANDEYLTKVVAQPIVLDYLSLWRSSLMLTTIGPGEIRLTYDPESQHKIDIDFGEVLDTSLARDGREELMIKNMKSEQERFRETFLGFFGKFQHQIEIRSRNQSQKDFNLSAPDSFEILMLQESLGRD